MTRISHPGQRKGPRPDSVTVRPADGAGTHRRRVRTRLATRGRLRTSHPKTVWACADDHHPAGTGLLADWLHTAVIKIVTSYTRPGDRVLLLAPHAIPAESTAGWPGTVPSTTGAGSRPGPLSGLHEAGWTVVRLGRDVVTQTVTTHAASISPAVVPITDATLWAGSGLGPAGRSPVGSGGRPEPDFNPVGNPVTGPRADPPGLRENRFDAIIATVDPSRTDWLDTLDWSALLTPRGILTVITHCDIGVGPLVDPIGPVVTAIRSRRMVYHDHVVMLETPLSEITARRAPRNADGPAVPDAVTRMGRGAAVPSAQAHADLLIFTRSAVPTAASTTATARGGTSDV